MTSITETLLSGVVRAVHVSKQSGLEMWPIEDSTLLAIGGFFCYARGTSFVGFERTCSTPRSCEAPYWYKLPRKEARLHADTPSTCTGGNGADKSRRQHERMAAFHARMSRGVPRAQGVATTQAPSSNQGDAQAASRSGGSAGSETHPVSGTHPSHQEVVNPGRLRSSAAAV